MTLDVSRTQGTSAMAVSASPRNNNNLSFSISRLLETKGSPKNNSDPTVSEASFSAAAAKLVSKESPPESPLDVDDRSDRSEDDHDADEDVKVNDSDDSDDSEGRAEDSRKMSLAEYAAGVHHPQHQSIDWYALYALQQQQQQHPQLGLLPPGHSGPPGFSLPGRGPSTGGLPYLSYPSPAGGAVTTTSSSCGPPGYSTEPGQLNPSSLSPHHPHHPHHMQPHHPHMGGGVNSAFAALLEATVFKDRLAAGIILLPTHLLLFILASACSISNG